VPTIGYGTIKLCICNSRIFEEVKERWRRGRELGSGLFGASCLRLPLALSSGQCVRRSVVAHHQIRGVYSRASRSVSDARTSVSRYLRFYNERRPHASLDGMTPDQAYFTLLPLRSAAKPRQMPDLSKRKSCSDNRDHFVI
jgi:hypothetical protein